MARRTAPAISTSSRVAADAATRTPVSAGVSESIFRPDTLTLNGPASESAGAADSAGRVIVTVPGTRATRSAPL